MVMYIKKDIKKPIIIKRTIGTRPTKSMENATQDINRDRVHYKIEHHDLHKHYSHLLQIFSTVKLCQFTNPSV